MHGANADDPVELKGMMSRNHPRFLLLPLLALVLGVSGCNVTETYPVGSLSAEVRNENNVGVQGVLLDLYRVEGNVQTQWRHTVTGADGIGVFGAEDGGVLTGLYYVRLTTTPTMELAPGESNDRPVVLGEGDEVRVIFRVIPRAPPPA